MNQVNKSKISINQKFFFNDKKNSVQINVVSDFGKTWISVMNVNPFGLKSSAWTGNKRKNGLRKQVMKQVEAAKQNLIENQPPKIIFSFKKGITQEIADALVDLGINSVEGEIVELPDFKTNN